MTICPRQVRRLAICAMLSAAPAIFGADIETYAHLPDIRSISISPSGQHYAFIQNIDGQSVFGISEAGSGAFVTGANAADLKARSVYFATDRHVILRVSKTRRSVNIRGRWEQGQAISFNLETQKMNTLLKGQDTLYAAQGGLGRIVGVDPVSRSAFMPAWVGTRNPTHDLFRVSLDTGRGKVIARGSVHTLDWFVDPAGRVLAREDYNNRTNTHSVRARSAQGQWQTIYQHETEIPEIVVSAITPESDALVFMRTSEDGAQGVYRMALADGKVTGPLYAYDNRDIEYLLTRGLHREFLGAAVSGMLPSYEYASEHLTNSMSAVQGAFPRSAVVPVSATADQRKLIFRVSGNEATNDYMVFDADTGKLARIGKGYPDVAPADIAEVTAIRYAASDGLLITAVLTWPSEDRDRQGLPLVVFPHGGPESYDSIRFDWWAQYFARAGYLVLQPNFRGSSGHGVGFLHAGRGEWGRKMQSDISDGVRALIADGTVDPNRICIMGASYGGYAALAGGAFTPELYRCVVSVAGISDIPRMLSTERYESGSDHWVVSYWETLVGNGEIDRDALDDISPVNFAAAYQAPVLLVHGKDDVVVPLTQSNRMRKALKRADKEVELLKLDGEDHWLSSSRTRIEMLTAVSQFIQQHNPALKN